LFFSLIANHSPDGRKAVDLVQISLDQSKEYDLIFMDVQMPNMDGLEATRLIRQLGFKKPIVALSAYSDDTNVRSCHESGMDDFVSKPIQIARLRLVLKTYCPEEEKTAAPSSPGLISGTTPGPSTSVMKSRPLSAGVASASASRGGMSSSGLRKEAARLAEIQQEKQESDKKAADAEKGGKMSSHYEDDVSPLSTPPPPPT